MFIYNIEMVEEKYYIIEYHNLKDRLKYSSLPINGWIHPCICCDGVGQYRPHRCMHAQDGVRARLSAVAGLPPLAVDQPRVSFSASNATTSCPWPGGPAAPRPWPAGARRTPGLDSAPTVG